MNYNIINSGSDGNAVVVNHILFDIGLPYQRLKKEINFMDLDAIFISHKHGDHLNVSSYKHIIQDYPLLPIYAPINVHEKLKNIPSKSLHLTSQHEQIELPNNLVTIYQAHHEEGIMTDTYEVQTRELDFFMYATDFWNFNDLPQGKYDYCFIEANHDENWLQIYKELHPTKDGSVDLPYWTVKSTNRHTTKQAAQKYFLQHAYSSKSVEVELHKSSRFYDLM